MSTDQSTEECYQKRHRRRVDASACVKLRMPFVLMLLLMDVATLNSQSSLGSGPGSPAAVGSLGAASPALPSSLYPAGPSLLAAAPRHTSRPLLSLGPDTQQTRRVLMGSNQLISHVDVFGCSPRAALTAYGCHSKAFKWGSKPYHSSSVFIYVKVFHSSQDCHHGSVS